MVALSVKGNKEVESLCLEDKTQQNSNAFVSEVKDFE